LRRSSQRLQYLSGGAHHNPNVRVGYSENLATWFFSIDTGIADFSQSVTAEVIRGWLAQEHATNIPRECAPLASPGEIK